MATLHLITGACRSGKSRYAQLLAEALPGRRLFIATCPPLDDETRRRIQLHQADRAGRGWELCEEQLDLATAIEKAHSAPAPADVVLIDCLTLWINNLMHHADQQSALVSERDITQKTQRLLHVCANFDSNIVFVTNEVGWGIVPDNAMARQFRDLVGRANQTIAAAADHVVLMCAGLPMTLKGTENEHGTSGIYAPGDSTAGQRLQSAS